MQMSVEVQRINKQRVYWHDRAHELLTRVLIASFEGDKEEYKRLMDDLETAQIIIWRFDRKLRNALVD